MANPGANGGQPVSADGRRKQRQTVDDARVLVSFKELVADEPTPPADGSCCVCGKPRDPERSRIYAHGVAHIDPFCSTLCAKRWHGASEDQERPPGPRTRGSYVGRHGG